MLGILYFIFYKLNNKHPKESPEETINTNKYRLHRSGPGAIGSGGSSVITAAFNDRGTTQVRRRRVYLEIAVFALGLLLAVRDVRATEAPDGHLSLGLPFQTSDNFRFGAFTESSDEEGSASELNRKLTNPVGTLWSISNQFNNFELNNGHWNNNWNFQPVLPLSLTKDWNLITRPVMPFYNIVPHETAPDQFE